MAYQDALHSNTYNLFTGVFACVKAFFAMIGSGLISISQANQRVLLVERLQAKSDAELAAMGMKREDIVRRVFRDMLDV